MKRLRTTLIILHLTTLIWFVSGFGHGVGESKNLQRLYRVSDVIESDANDNETLITYQPINQPDDSAVGIIFDVTLTTPANRQYNDDDDDSTLLISTLSKDSCESETENYTLPAWKINKKWRKFRLKINQNTTQEFLGSTLFLCVYNDYLGQMQHLGERSQLKIDSKNLHSNDDR
jgi:hypothetical protein